GWPPAAPPASLPAPQAARARASSAAQQVRTPVLEAGAETTSGIGLCWSEVRIRGFYRPGVSATYAIRPGRGIRRSGQPVAPSCVTAQSGLAPPPQGPGP